MNTHEIERIAASMNMLRPDWPKQQLKTLLSDERITNRPRRDVVVALGWVACEPNTHTPYRVLEAGPWWKAAGVETTNVNPLADKGPWCKNCGCGPSHPLHRTGDCVYTIWPAQMPQEREWMAKLAQIRRELTAVLPPEAHASDLPSDGERCAEEPCVRGAGHTGPHQGPPDEATDETDGETA